MSSTKVVEEMFAVARPTAKYQASVWGDRFLTYDCLEDNENESQVIGEVKEIVREKLVSNKIGLTDKLNLIDVVQRLGVSYHFETEIEQVLHCIYFDYECMSNSYHDDDLYNCALQFRLLRQQGYNVSSDIFKKFLKSEGQFKTSIRNDIKGLLSLHEAALLRFQGEDILEKALDFTTKQFETMLLHERDFLDQINPYLAEQINNSLNQSYLRGFIRIEARNYFLFYENNNLYDKKLLEFAKLDYNVFQRIYQRELAELTRWWKNLDFANKFPFSRDRLVEGYYFASSVYFEPEYAYGRKNFAKVVVFLTTMDDIYDAYGTWDELLLFTDAINRWEWNDLDHLSKPIRYFIDAFHDYIKTLEDECVERKMMHGAQYLKEAFKFMANGYMKEARWLHEKHIPKLEEYMSLALITGGGRFMSIISFVGMDHDLATKEAFDWAFNDPPIIKATGSITRLVNDIEGFKFEHEREHLASSVHCYMNQHGVSEDVAIFELRKQVIDAWKDINFELIQPTKVPKALLNRVVGHAIMMVIYRGGVDGFTHPQLKLKDFTDLFINSIDV